MKNILILVLLASAYGCSSSNNTVIETTCYLDPTFVGGKVAVICAEANIDLAWFNLKDRYQWYDMDDTAPNCHVVYPGQYTLTFQPADGFSTPMATGQFAVREGCWYSVTGAYDQ